MMLADVFSDMTALHARAWEERRGREETAALPLVDRRFDETTFIQQRGAVPALSRAGTMTPASGGLTIGDELTAPEPTEVLVDAARDTRVTLLARKYENGGSVEDEARLKILTERLRRLSPRVTTRDLDAVTVVVSDLERASKDLAAIRERFGLR